MEPSWKKYVDAWNKSQKYIQLKLQLQQKNRDMANMDIDKRDEIIAQLKEKGMTKAQILAQCETIIEFFESDAEKESIEWFTANISVSMNKKELYFDFIKTIITWFGYLAIYIEEEDYDMAAKINRCIGIEVFEFKFMLTKYYTFDAEDEQKVEYIIDSHKEMFLPQ